MADRRRSLWVDTVFQISVSTNSEQVQDLMGSLIETETRLSQLTLVRTIIGIDIAYSVHDAGEGSQHGAVGIFVAGREAILAGVASLPHPDVQGDYPATPWVWRARYRIFGFAADQPAVFVRRVDLDIRAQRKMANGELVLVMANNAAEGQTSTLLFSGLVRCLFLI